MFKLPISIIQWMTGRLYKELVPSPAFKPVYVDHLDIPLVRLTPLVPDAVYKLGNTYMYLWEVKKIPVNCWMQPNLKLKDRLFLFFITPLIFLNNIFMRKDMYGKYSLIDESKSALNLWPLIIKWSKLNNHK